jgi:hypothetical protein
MFREKLCIFVVISTIFACIKMTKFKKTGCHFDIPIKNKVDYD